MAKNKAFSKDSEQKSGERGPMAKVIISNKLGNNHYSFKEVMVEEDNVKNYISENKS